MVVRQNAILSYHMSLRKILYKNVQNRFSAESHSKDEKYIHVLVQALCVLWRCTCLFMAMYGGQSDIMFPPQSPSSLFWEAVFHWTWRPLPLQAWLASAWIHLREASTGFRFLPPGLTFIWVLGLWLEVICLPRLLSSIHFLLTCVRLPWEDCIDLKTTSRTAWRASLFISNF